jgi:hypothetical protein
MPLCFQFFSYINTLGSTSCPGNLAGQSWIWKEKERRTVHCGVRISKSDWLPAALSPQPSEPCMPATMNLRICPVAVPSCQDATECLRLRSLNIGKQHAPRNYNLSPKESAPINFQCVEVRKWSSKRRIIGLAASSSALEPWRPINT